MATLYPLSAVNWTELDVSYFNSNRMLSATTVALTGINDVTINEDTLFYLTDKKTIKNIFTNNKSTTALSLTANYPFNISSYDLGMDNSKFVKYYFCPSNIEYSKNLNFREVENDKKINHVMFSNFKTDEDSLNFNIFNLKNAMTPYYEYDSSGTDLRSYHKIYTGNNQRTGYKNMYLGYSSDKIELTFKEDDTTYFHYPYNGISVQLSAANLIEQGSKPGDIPLNSDIIGIDQFGYCNHTPSGPISRNNNGNFLCYWLSGSNDCGCVSKWMSRWYDPNTVTQGDALIESGTSNCQYVWDTDAIHEFIPNVRYYYNRYGNTRNGQLVNSLSSDLVLHYDTWANTVNDISNNGNNGYITDYDKTTSSFNLDGTVYCYTPPSDSILTTDNEFTASICINSDNWCCGKNAQLLGNYHYGGWGIFYNTGMNINLITVGDADGFLYSFNINSQRVFEKDLNKANEFVNKSVDYIVTDLDGMRWIADNVNKKLYKIDVDDLIVKVVDLPMSFNIKQLQIDNSNQVNFFEGNANAIITHDEDGNWVSSITAPTSANVFEFDFDGNIQYSNGNEMAINSDNDIFKIHGCNLYKNSQIIYHFSSYITDLKIDKSDQVWITYCGDRLVKLNSKGELLYNVKITDILENETSTKITLTSEFGYTGCDRDYVWMIFENESYIAKIVPETGELLDLIEMQHAIKSRNCAKFVLKGRGDISGYDINRKFNYNNGIISPTNPALTYKVKFIDSCNKKLFKYAHINICELSNDWHVAAISYDRFSEKLRFFFDGCIYQEYDIDIKWKLDYNQVSPIIIGGNSGKLGSENIEKSILLEEYWVGEIDDVRLYNKALSPFSVRAIADLKLKNFNDLVWNITINEKSYIEQVERFFMSKKPGHISNYFNLKINGLNSINSDLKLLIESAIKNSISEFIPANTKLKDIVWN